MKKLLGIVLFAVLMMGCGNTPTPAQGDTAQGDNAGPAGLCGITAPSEQPTTPPTPVGQAGPGRRTDGQGGGGGECGPR
jgi:hypothetical protein